MRKEVELCDFCPQNLESRVFIAREQCIFCKRKLCKEGYHECKGKPNPHRLPSILKEFLPVICKDCQEIIGYNTAIDEFSDFQVQEMFNKLLLKETEKIRKQLKKKIVYVYRRLYKAGLKNQKIDERLAKGAEKDTEKEPKYVSY